MHRQLRHGFVLARAALPLARAVLQSLPGPAAARRVGDDPVVGVHQIRKARHADADRPVPQIDEVAIGGRTPGHRLGAQPNEISHGVTAPADSGG